MTSQRPEKLMGTAATLGALSISTTILRCYVRIRVLKKWGWDDTFIILAFATHMWYTFTIFTGIHYGTGKRTPDITVADAVHAMRCWWLCFIAYAITITFAKLSLGFLMLRLASIITLHRIVTIILTTAAVLVGAAFLFVCMFQCLPMEFFWTRMQGATNGKCISIDVIVGMTYLYGSIAAATDVGFGILLGVLVWKLKVNRKTKFLMGPLLGLACIASYAAIVRMPFIKNFRSPDFLYSTLDISLWSTVEVGISIFASNLAMLRPLVQHVSDKARSLTSRVRGQTKGSASETSTHELRHYKDQKPKLSVGIVELGSEATIVTKTGGESTISLTHSIQQV